MSRKGFGVLLLAGVALWLGGATAWAAEAAQKGGAAGDKMTYFMVAAFSTMFGLAVAAIGGATAQGKSIVSALEGIARNPGAAGDIRTSLIIGLALIESLVIYTLLVAIILLFVDPFRLLGG
ncbi:MAG: F0F1 ATP synthase subunit C [Candidatus Tectomicrobia bacterium]|nr:F0F1 ATP synthase subunit C [Candidatus Tectomicrobia bacterium]